MAGFALTRRHIGRISFVFVVGATSFSVGATTLIWNSPFTPFIVSGVICAAAAGFFLLQKPLTALNLSVFLSVMPFKLEYDAAYDVIRNVALAVALCAFVIQLVSQRRPITWNVVCSLVALYTAWAFVTLLWAPDLIESRRKLIAYGMGLAMIVMLVDQIRSLRALDGLMRTLATVGWILVAGGLYTLAFEGYHSGERLKVLDVNENLFGLLLILMMPAVIWVVLRSNGSKRAIYMAFSVVYILCTIVMIALSGSRGSALSLILVLLAFWFWRPVRPWAMIGVVFIAGILTAAPFALGILMARFERQEGGELGGRLILWQASVLLLEDHPLTGAGIGNGAKELNWYIRSLENNGSPRRDLPSHNPILEAGVDTGLIGIAIYVSTCVAALVQFLRYGRRAHMREGALAAYFPLVLGTAVGYLATWLKGGGLEAHTSYFILLILLTFPARLSRSREAGSGLLLHERLPGLPRVMRHFSQPCPWLPDRQP